MGLQKTSHLNNLAQNTSFKFVKMLFSQKGDAGMYAKSLERRIIMTQYIELTDTVSGPSAGGGG